MADNSDGKRPDRLHGAATEPLDPGSLVGSFFHSGDDHQWQGCVVAEPAPGVYLVELFEWFTGSANFQRLVRITDMADWQFYDDIEWMKNTYEYGRVPWERKPAVPS